MYQGYYGKLTSITQVAKATLGNTKISFYFSLDKADKEEEEEDKNGEGESNVSDFL